MLNEASVICIAINDQTLRGHTTRIEIALGNGELHTVLSNDDNLIVALPGYTHCEQYQLMHFYNEHNQRIHTEHAR